MKKIFILTGESSGDKLAAKVISNLKKSGIKCFTGSCPEIYLEKAFKNKKNLRVKRLENCKILGKTSLAFDMNHTLSQKQHKKQLVKIKQKLSKILNV